jgi:ATP-dependent DNA helicase RecQ
MYDFAESSRCAHVGLAWWFGERIDDCGASCDRCGDLGFSLGAIAAPTASSTKGGQATIIEEATPEDQDLFEELRGLRKRLASERGLPAYMVFNDATLRAMAVRRPTTEHELLAVPGVGAKKLETYGDVFLAAVRDWSV